MTLARDERATLATLLDELGPDAPTLCEGWTTSDLAAHLIVRENDPIGAIGIMVAPLQSLTERRMQQVLTAPWAEVVGRVRRGPQGLTPFRIPAVEAAANGVEYFIHTEDIRRAQPGGAEPRDLGQQTEEELWKRVGGMAKLMWRKAEVGIVLERSDRPGQSVRVRPGERTVTVVGLPSELLLLSSGRAEHAQVEVIGEPEAVAAFRATATSL